MSTYENIVTTLTRFAEQAKTQPLNLGQALDSLDEAAYSFIALILVLPFMQPIPLGPLTVIGGLTFATLGWQLWRGHESPVLPRRIRTVVMSEKTWRILVSVCLKIVGFCHKFTRPRYTFLVTGQQGQKIGALVMISAGLLMAIPFGLLPFNNFLPGLAVLFYCIGQLEEDGLMVIISFFWLAVTAIYFGAFFFGLWYFGSEALGRWFSLSGNLPP
ncbi:MAG TPA: exopolysaccharide biosynthesis protein [Methylophilaceae bacterium]|nr:exopolysaccharide biosynthesis protein [Methylophilaceae bacterium]